MSGNALEDQKEASEKSDPESEKTTTQDAESLEKEDKCNSHALNMLADLALANSPMSSDGSQASSTGIPLQECCHLQDGKILPKTSDHEYHRAMKKLKGASLSGKVCQHSLLSPGEGDLSPELPSSSQERTCTSSRQKGNKKPGVAKSQAVLPGEAADILDPNIHTHDISAEHSYASSALESSKKGVPHSPDLKNGVKYVKSGPLLTPGKVLPFRHQMTVCHQQKQLKNNVQIMTGRLKEDFSKFHKVTLRDRTVKVTFQWEPDYLFTLDSKYTNNSLEKTVVRAVHGPWDVSLSDNIEEMKLILHMWVALFHSKPFKSPTVRTVVEHSNPAKYVSLNRIIDPLELVDNSEGAYSLEKCPADSISEATQISSKVEERAISLSDKPLSCNELSKTNCIEDELQPTNPKETNDLPPKREVLQTIASSCEDAVPPLVEVADGKLEGEFQLDPGTPVESLHGNALGESSDDSAKHWKLRADAKTESSEAVNLSEISQSDATPVNTKHPDNSGKQHVENTAASASAESQETSSVSLAEEKGESHRIGGVKLLRTSETAWLEASAQEDGGLHCEEVIKSQDLPMDEEDGNEESMEWESIDLALSDSNDTDEESRDVDLDQEGTEEIGMAGEGETGRMGGMALPAESLLFPVITSATVSEYQIDLPNTKEDFVVSPANSTSLHQKNLVEGFCLLQEDIAQDKVDSVPPQASSVQDEKVELSTTEDTSVSANQMDVGENSFISWENKGIKSAYFASTQDSELLQAEKDLATQGELERKPLFPNPDDLTDISCDSMEEKDLSQSNSVSLQATLEEVSTEPTKHHIFLNRMDLIEDISQDDIHLADSAAFQTSEGCQVHNSLSTQREATGNQDRSLLLVQNLAPAKEMVLIQGSCAPQKEEGTSLVSTAQFPDSPVHQTSQETTELVRNQEDSSTSARTTALPEPVGLAENTCISQEKKACHLADTVPLKANEAIQIQQSTDILEEQNTRQRFKADNWKFHLNSEDQKCCVKNNIGATSAIQDVTSDEKINQISLTISEDVKSVLCELIDAVNARREESEETCAQETSSLNGISSSTLEYVTPPDSEEENTTTDQFARTDQRWMVNENLEQCRIFSHQDTATSQGKEVCHSALHENMRYDQMNTFEKRTPQENEPASSALDTLPSSSCIDWPTTSTTSLLYKSPSVSLANPRYDDSIASVLCETEVGQTSHRASISEREDQLSKACAKARDLCCTRTFHSFHRHESFTGELGLINSLNKTWSGPTQSTLDMECLRFYYRVKEVLRNPQPPTSSAKELSLPVKGEALQLRKVPEMPLLNPPPRSRSPLLITIVNPGPRYGILHEYPRRSRHSDIFEPPPLTSSQESLAKAARYKNQGQDPVVPFHLSKLNYKNKLKDSRGDISVIMDEFAEFSRVMTFDDRPSNQGREPNTTSEDAPENRVPSLPRRTASYEHLFTELWSTVHTKLKNVAQEACKKTYAFYLMETDDDPFFGRVKNLLKKAGHTETEPLLFCKANHVETERLMVIIRNEDIFPHIHKIPCLLRLKRFPNVTFAGVDSPEDILEHTYQELFQGGGFVVSDDKVLEMMTIGELKEMVKTLEMLNGHGRWRWLLHYKEVKKLREDARANSAAHAKESLLKSCQGANITEALHYHQCDSKAVLRSEHLNCLLNLQVQHISRRFAVFITEKLSTNREALENKGILALDVNTFLTTAEDTQDGWRLNFP